MAEACPGHPRLSSGDTVKTWMPGTRPGMTKHFSPVRSLWMRRDVGLTQAASLPTVIFKDAVRG
jgi:hypothetical protein